MIITTKKYVFAAVVGFLFLNCSLDTNDILQHPDAANPETEITVEITNMFIRLEQSGNISENVSRDSLHIGFGLPAADWSVSSVKFYPATHFRPLKDVDPADMDSEIDVITPMLQDSLTVFKSRQLSAVQNPSMPDFFPGRTFEVSVQDTDSSFALDADSVNSWYGFSGAVDLSLNMGDQVDIVIENIDSTIEMDSLGYRLIPVFITATIKVGADLGNFNLYYYTKTAALPPMPSENEMDVDIGSMTYHPLEVKTGTISNIGPSMVSSGSSSLLIRQIGNRAYQITVKTEEIKDGYHLGIFDIKGNLVKKFSFSDDNITSHPLIWNATDIAERPVKAGVYLVNLRSMSGSVSRKITVDE